MSKSITKGQVVRLRPGTVYRDCYGDLYDPGIGIVESLTHTGTAFVRFRYPLPGPEERYVDEVAVENLVRVPPSSYRDNEVLEMHFVYDPGEDARKAGGWRLEGMYYRRLEDADGNPPSDFELPSRLEMRGKLPEKRSSDGKKALFIVFGTRFEEITIRFRDNTSVSLRGPGAISQGYAEFHDYLPACPVPLTL